MYLITLIVAVLIATSQCSPIITRKARIIGGTPAFEGQYKFAAAIYSTTPNGKYFCGASLLNNYWLISSGQCLNGATLFDIILGSIYLESNEANRVEISTTQSVIHPDFDAATFSNDVGLIRALTQITYTDYIGPVEFPPPAPLVPSSMVRAIGWGQISNDEGGPVNQLYQTHLTVITNDECKLFYQNQLQDNMVCAVGSYNEGTCIGDMGTPLVQIFNFNHLFQVGVASFLSGNGCESTDPSGFTRLYPYVNWIQNLTATSS